MTYQTHRVYSISFALITTMLVYNKSMSSINFYLCMIIILMISKYSAMFPDVDHDWSNVKEKTITNWIINKIIHATGGKHRSWQTHSIDICAYFTIASYYIPRWMYSTGRISQIDYAVLSILLIGFSSGWISHLFSDMLTSGSVRLFCFMKIKVRLVPRKLFGLKFNTGQEWERFNYKAIRFINIFLGIYTLIYPFQKEIINFLQKTFF